MHINTKHTHRHTQPLLSWRLVFNIIIIVIIVCYFCCKIDAPSTITTSNQTALHLIECKKNYRNISNGYDAQNSNIGKKKKKCVCLRTRVTRSIWIRIRIWILCKKKTDEKIFFLSYHGWRAVDILCKTEKMKTNRHEFRVSTPKKDIIS